MEPEKFTNNSSDPVQISVGPWADRFNFELPVDPDYIEQHRSLSLAEMLPLIANRRKWFPMTEAERMVRRDRHVTAEFILP